MRVIIIEDETPAADRLKRMLHALDAEIKVVRTLDSIEASVKYLQTAQEPDLIFMDIQLADGLSFSIFQQVKVTTPVVFTTAFDHYTLKAFKVNSVDYLLKPIDSAELQQALEKFRELHSRNAGGFAANIDKLLQELNAPKYKERLLIKRGQLLQYIKTDSVAYYYAEGKLCYAIDFSGQSYLLENNLYQLEEQLAPNRFFRVNRQLLVNIDSVRKIHTWLGGRLKLELNPPTQADTLVSRERVTGFKTWLGR